MSLGFYFRNYYFLYVVWLLVYGRLHASRFYSLALNEAIEASQPAHLLIFIIPVQQSSLTFVLST